MSTMRTSSLRRASRIRRNRRACLVCDILELRSLLASFVVTNVADAGPESLRQVILDLDATVGTPGAPADTITFQIPGAGVQTIQPLTPLPNITEPVVIDGRSQGGPG